MIFIKKFIQISKSDTAQVGGKGASLGELTRVAIPVPPGFVVTTETHQKFNNDSLPPEVENKILDAYDKLRAERVAVRSSAIAEDSSQASWAGQLETYLNVNRDNLIEKIRKCWDSIKSERALAYAGEQNLNEEDLFVAVVVQKMVESKASGVMFTVNPVTKDCDEIMIEAGFGLGEMLVQGLITPDNFIIDRETLDIKSKNVETQETMLVFREGENQEVPVPENYKDKQAVTDYQVKYLAQLGKRIENHYGKPMDIEWAIDDQDKLWILQSRPITTL